MKLILQITLGVFLGSSASSLLQDVWQQHKAELQKAENEKVLAEQEKIREEQGRLFGNILQQSRQLNPATALTPPGDFIPDDAQTEKSKP
ncbi:hypothetical protein [Methylomonas sp. AM2-LC]|uniref:hypothetical protein n=1 Tax=Methylomonas sp. AM2-LC TaxID=3153301 RepID=UPI003264DBDF